jgi:hypothetical protein
MAGRVELVTLVLLFLAALLVHYLMATKESFKNPPPTPLTPELLKSEMDSVVTELYADYLKLSKEKMTDMVKVRLVFMASTLTALNDLYKRFNTIVIPANMTLQDIQLVRQFLLYTLSPVYSSTVKSPATVNDLRLFLTRLNSLALLIKQKVVASNVVSVQNLNDTQKKIVDHTNVLMKKMPLMKADEIPVLKSDRYIVVSALAYSNFVISPDDLAASTTPIIDALPIATTSGNIVSTLLQTPTSGGTPSPASTPTAASQGFKFSELVKTLMSYDGIAATQAAQAQAAQAQAAQAQAAQAQATQAALQAPSLTQPKPTTTDMNNLKEFVSDEINAQLAKYKLGPKDVQNVNVVDRKTTPVTPETKAASSDALEQGKWFRNEASPNCPYATGQQATGFPQPNPIDMNEYVRKDSIPCWGCNLK